MKGIIPIALGYWNVVRRKIVSQYVAQLINQIGEGRSIGRLCG